MATDLGNLADQLDLELAHEVDYPGIIELLQGAVTYVNASGATSFTLTGTTLDRDATSLEQALLILYGMLIHLRSESIRWSKVAIVHSNVAGRTKIDGVEFALSKRANDIRAEIANLVAQLGLSDVIADVAAEELGETLPYTWPYGRYARNPLQYPYPGYV